MKIIDLQYDFIPNDDKPIPNAKEVLDKLCKLITTQFIFK
jgi:hypothetical protein